MTHGNKMLKPAGNERWVSTNFNPKQHASEMLIFGGKFIPGDFGLPPGLGDFVRMSHQPWLEGYRRWQKRNASAPVDPPGFNKACLVQLAPDPAEASMQTSAQPESAKNNKATGEGMMADLGGEAREEDEEKGEGDVDKVAPEGEGK